MTWTMNSFQKYRLMAPGPVALHPEILCELSAIMVHHRTPLFDQILKRSLENLKKVFQTSMPVYIVNGTGSTGMEAALVNLLNPDDEVLCIVSGKFGERWQDMAKTFGFITHSIEVPWGSAVNPDDVEQFLINNKNIKAVLTQACETSTAVLHPIQKLSEMTKKYPNTLLLVDAITAAATFDLPMDRWGLDAVIAGSQKAFMLPTGLSFVAFSEKAQKSFLESKTPRYVLDLRLEKKANEKGETFFSSSVALIKALDKSLQVMLEMGLPNWFKTIQHRADFVRFVFKKLNLALYSKSPSPSLTAGLVPDGIDGQKLREHLEKKYQITVMGGQDQLKGKILRVGHMGYLTTDDHMAFAGALYHSLKDFNFSPLPDENQFFQDCEQFLKAQS